MHDDMNVYLGQRLVYASASRVPSIAANSVQVVKMASAFASVGFTVTLLSRPGKTEYVPNNYRVSPNFELKFIPWIPLRGVGGLLFGRMSSLSVMRHIYPHFIYGRDIYTLWYLRHRRIPFWYEAHVLPPNWLRRSLESDLLRSPALICLIVISEALKNDYSLLFPWFDKRRIVVAHDGADPHEQQPGLRKVNLRDNKSRIIVGFVGQLYPGKGMEIVGKLARHLPHIHFVVVGGCQEDVCFWREQFPYTNLKFCGQVQHSRVPQYLSEFDILLAPYQRQVSVYGGCGDVSRWMSPLKIFEYMASGKAIVASNLPVINEVLTDDHSAILCEPEDVEQWVDALQKLAENERLRHRLGHAARDDFLNRYTWEVRVNRILQTLDLQKV